MSKSKYKRSYLDRPAFDWRADALKAVAAGESPELTQAQLDTLISEGVLTWVYRDGVRVLVDKAEFEA